MTLRQEINFDTDLNYVAVLDHGFVGLVDSMGNDQSIVRAARVSYGQGTKSISDDRNLIRYLMRHEHTTPFEMCEVVFHLKLPIFVMRQLVRHRTASLNEYSARYSVVTDEFYIPDPNQIKPQSSDNKQGRSGDLSSEETDKIITDMKQLWSHNYNVYESHINEFGLARETARAVLPVGGYTECYWKTNLKNFLHMVRLRADNHAQFEIQEYAKAMYNFAKYRFPIAIEAFEDYQMNAVKFSRMELKMIQDYMHKPMSFDVWIETNGGAANVASKYKLSQRELKEFASKLNDKR